jgi:TBC1 domain family member 14
LAKNLEMILQTYACYRPDVGYVQGMSYIAAMLVYYLDEFNAFKCMANILSKRMSFDFYQLNNDLIHQFTSTFDFFFQLHLPSLYEYFHVESISSGSMLYL